MFLYYRGVTFLEISEFADKDLKYLFVFRFLDLSL